jgi:hypothetical protein
MGPLKLSATIVKWVLTLAILVVVLGAAYFVREQLQSRSAAPSDQNLRQPIKDGVIILRPKDAEWLACKAEVAKEIDWVPRVPVYGRVLPNPRGTTEVRAAFAGRLRLAGAGKWAGKWPELAKSVEAGELLGQIEIRPPDPLDVQAKLTDAKLKQDGARKVLMIQQERVARFESAPKSLARGELDAALVARAEAETQLATAEGAVKLYSDILAALHNQDPKQATWTLPVTAPASGEITELSGQPDMVVEAGALIAKVVDFRRALIRVDIPLQLLTAAPPDTLKLSVLPAIPPALQGPTNRPEPPEAAATVSAKLVGVAAQVDPLLQAAGYLYEVDVAASPAGSLWRPGLFVKSQFKVNDAKPIAAVAIPKSALLFHQGRALVYLKLSELRYQRKEVTVLGRDGEQWIIGRGVDADDLVVTEGAGALLSMEFRADVDD